MVKHVLHVEKEIVPDTLEWKLQPNKDGSITLECREIGPEDGALIWSSIITVGTDGRFYWHEWLETNLLQWGENRGPVISPKPSWNTNPEELKEHYGKLVTVKGVNWGPHSGILRNIGGGTLGVFGPQGDDWSFGLKTFEKFCVHELPED